MQLFLFSITFCKMFLLLGYGLHMLVFMVHLRELASGLESTVIASGATGTTDVYRRAFPRWRCFAASSDEIQAFPAKPEHFKTFKPPKKLTLSNTNMQIACLVVQSILVLWKVHSYSHPYLHLLLVLSCHDKFCWEQVLF